MVFLHLLAEEGPFPANDKVISVWAAGVGVWVGAQLSRAAAFNSSSHVGNTITSSLKAANSSFLCYRGMEFHHIISFLHLLKFRWEKEFSKSQEVENMSKHLAIPVDQQGLSICDPVHSLRVGQQFWILQRVGTRLC